MFNDVYRKSRSLVCDLLFENSGFVAIMSILIIAEIVLCSTILQVVPYTEIDWVAYMQEVEGLLNGTLDYDKLHGQTGPCVYPAGFLYVYSILYWITNSGKDIRMGQWIFTGLYLVSIWLIFNMYRLSRKVPPYALIFMCIVSYRIHSIYLLRLFNDPFTMLMVYGAVNALLYDHFTVACILFSLGVSIKMNALLFAPGLLFILLYRKGIIETIGHLSECLIVQLVVGAPFLFHNPKAYLMVAFNFGRQFMYKWTVNWRIIPEEIFLDRRFHSVLLGLHCIFLLVVLIKFIRSRGGFRNFLTIEDPKRRLENDPTAILYPLFISNFVGVMFSRSLHYQFYVWYFHTIVYLLWCVERFSSPFRLLLLGLIEICWNTYPSTMWSSGLLHVCHLALLLGLLTGTVPPPIHDSKKPQYPASNAKIQQIKAMPKSRPKKAKQA